jgi:hypothetical protein
LKEHIANGSALSRGIIQMLQITFSKAFLFLVLAISLCANTPAGRSARLPSPTPAANDVKLLRHQTRSQKTNEEITQLADAQHGPIAESFLFVARDAVTYEFLRQLVGTLPEQNDQFFAANAVVAVFLGQRRTSGFGIDIVRTADGGVRIIESKPPKGTRVKMVLTAPLKVVAISIGRNEPLVLSLDDTWKVALRSYRVVTGEITITGGFAGRKKNLQVGGVIGKMRVGELATFMFDVQSSDDKIDHRLVDVSSGKVNPTDKIVLNHLDAFGLTGAIQTPFRVSVEFTKEEQEMTLLLQTIAPTNIADNFAAVGEMKAALISPEKIPSKNPQ